MLQGGGYYNNIRSTKTVVLGDVNVYYSASTGPITSVNSGVSNQGGQAPTICNQNNSIVVGNSGTALIIAVVPSTNQARVCAFEVEGAGNSGTVLFESSTTTGCASLSTLWSTVPGRALGTGVGALFAGGTGLYVCVTNNSGAIATINISYASVFQSF